MFKQVNNLLKPVDNLLKELLSNPKFLISLKVFLVLYASLAAPKLPKKLLDMLNHNIVRVLVVFLIIYFTTKQPSLAILSSVAFIVTMQYANKMKIMEEYVEKFENHASHPDHKNENKPKMSGNHNFMKALKRRKEMIKKKKDHFQNKNKKQRKRLGPILKKKSQNKPVKKNKMCDPLSDDSEYCSVQSKPTATKKTEHLQHFPKKTSEMPEDREDKIGGVNNTVLEFELINKQRKQ